jgi:hypothetical protein
MRRNILKLLSFFLVGSSIIFGSGFEIKSLRIYSSSDQISFPIIDTTNPTLGTITIEFDIQSATMPNLSILFKFCDTSWNPYENAFLYNPGYNTENNLWFDRLPSTVSAARFHFKGSFPNHNVTFPFSGKWKFFIVDSQNRNKIFAEGKFYVVLPEVKLSVRIDKEKSQSYNSSFEQLNKTISIWNSFDLPDSLFSAYIKSVEIVENRKINYPIMILRNENRADRFFSWNGSSQFTFVARDLKPGNEYRQTDIRDYNRFNTKKINAQYDGIEVSNLFRKGTRDLNGSSDLIDYRNEHADYHFVNFKIRPPENINKPVFLVGAFNNWHVLPEYELYDDNGLLNLQIELKRGIYDYQFVTADLDEKGIANVDWNILEGNFWETENEYHIFLFYESQEKGGYDKIIGYNKIKTGELWKN